MSKLKQAHSRVETAKSELRALNKSIRDAVTQDAEWRKCAEDVRCLKEKMKSIENRVKADMLSDVEKLEDLKYEVKTAEEAVSDIALTMYANGETVEVVDEESGVVFEPLFRVRMVRTDQQVRRDHE